VKERRRGPNYSSRSVASISALRTRRFITWSSGSHCWPTVYVVIHYPWPGTLGTRHGGVVRAICALPRRMMGVESLVRKVTGRQPLGMSSLEVNLERATRQETLSCCARARAQQQSPEDLVLGLLTTFSLLAGKSISNAPPISIAENRRIPVPCMQPPTVCAGKPGLRYGRHSHAPRSLAGSPTRRVASCLPHGDRSAARLVRSICQHSAVLRFLPMWLPRKYACSPSIALAALPPPSRA
jgi:hypothetical protein